MIITKKLKIKWHSTTRKHYESKGYVFTKYRDEFEINIKDITEKSIQLVEFICDYCNGENQTEAKYKFRRYYVLMQQRKFGKDCCLKCKGKKVSEIYFSKQIPKEQSLAFRYPELIKEWSIRNEKTPYDFTSNSNVRVWWICEKGHEWEAIIQNRSTLGRGCPYCSGFKVSELNNLLVKSPDIAKEWHPTKNREMTPENVTFATHKKAWWLCKNCNFEWETSVSIRTGNHKSGCPQCNESKGERKVREFLDTHKIKYIKEKEFDGLIGLGGKLLRYDFAVVNEYHTIECLIEYDGEFHYHNVYEQSAHEIIEIHDDLKNNYCKLNNIRLLRIPYWELSNIEEILENELLK